jgi:hypothetical protein
MRFLSRLIAPICSLLLVCAECFAGTAAKSLAAAVHRPVFTERRLEELAQSLKGPSAPQAYAQLSAVAMLRSSSTLGMRAALALGYFDYGKGQYAGQRSGSNVPRTVRSSLNMLCIGLPKQI